MATTLTKTKTKRAPARSSKAGRKLIAAFQEELNRIDAGGRHAFRSLELPDEPGRYEAADVASLRAQVGVSQAIFARLVGVSTILVSAWEQGRRKPSRLARRLMDEIMSNPARWAAMVKSN